MYGLADDERARVEGSPDEGFTSSPRITA